MLTDSFEKTNGVVFTRLLSVGWVLLFLCLLEFWRAAVVRWPLKSFYEEPSGTGFINGFFSRKRHWLF